MPKINKQVRLCACGCERELGPDGTNSTSRYTNLPLHPSCGVREAFEGFYWLERWDRIGYDLNMLYKRGA